MLIFNLKINVMIIKILIIDLKLEIKNGFIVNLITGT